MSNDRWPIVLAAHPAPSHEAAETIRMLTEFVAKKGGQEYKFYCQFTEGGFGEYPEYRIHVWDTHEPSGHERDRYFELKAVGCDYGVRIDCFVTLTAHSSRGKICQA